MSVDVIIPAYNSQSYIKQTIESVKAQTVKPRRIIVVDDGSIDNTVKIVNQCKLKSPVKIDIYKKINGGLSSARNFGINKSKSPFVAFLDSDDLWLPTKLEKQIQKFRESKIPNIGVIFCDYEIVNENGLSDPSVGNSHLDMSVRGHIFAKLLQGNKVSSSGSGVIIKKNVFKRIGYFDESLPAAEDWDMWLRISRHYNFDFVPEKLVKIRRHGANMSNDEFRLLKGITLVLNKLVKSGEYSPMYIRSYRMRIIKYALTRLDGLSRLLELANCMSIKLRNVTWDRGRLLIDILKAPPILILESLKL